MVCKALSPGYNRPVRLELSYGKTTQPLVVPDRNLLAVIEPVDPGPTPDATSAIEQAAADCQQFLGGARRVLVLVNDYTRPTPNSPILAALQPVLSDRSVSYLVCSGTHRPPSEREYETIFGPTFWTEHRHQVRCHDCYNRTGLYFLGRTRFGTDVWLNKTVAQADAVITINSIEPHYFAGYTGGRKGFLPGVAGLETISHNHNMVTHPAALPFSLAGNPVHEDMTEAAQMVATPVFSIQVVQDRYHHLLGIHAGNLFESFRTACAAAYRLFAVPVGAQADVVISVLRPPYDINFYQAQRAVEFCRACLKKPSIQITVSPCRDGIGNDGFIQCFRNCQTPADLLRTAVTEQPQETARDQSDSLRRTTPSCPSGRSGNESSPHLAFGWHKSARLAQIMATTELYTVMGIDSAVVCSVFMTPFSTVQQALDAALAKLGPEATVIVIPDAGSVVPVLT